MTTEDSRRERLSILQAARDDDDAIARPGGVRSLLEQIGAFLLDEVAVPRLRPVAATVAGLPDGPIRMTYTPAGSGTFEYPDGPDLQESEG